MIVMNFNLDKLIRGKMHEIRFCKKDEYKLLQEFIKKYWKEDHIFVKSKKNT